MYFPQKSDNSALTSKFPQATNQTATVWTKFHHTLSCDSSLKRGLRELKY